MKLSMYSILFHIRIYPELLRETQNPIEVGFIQDVITMNDLSQRRFI